MIIRDAQSDDLETVAEIYNHAVLNTTAIFNDSTVDVANRAAWLADRISRPRCRQGRRIGHGLCIFWRLACIRWISPYGGTFRLCSHGPPGQRRGGSADAGTDRAPRAIGKHVMIAGIESRNVASIRLHEKLGFGSVEPIRQVGMKFGEWLDLTFMYLKLDDRPTPD